MKTPRRQESRRLWTWWCAGRHASHRDTVLDAREASLADVAALWPVAATALILAPAAFLAAATVWRSDDAAFLAPGTATAVLGVLTWVLLKWRKLRELPAHNRIAGLALPAIALAAYSAQAVQTLQHHGPHDRHRIAAVVCGSEQCGLRSLSASIVTIRHPPRQPPRA